MEIIAINSLKNVKDVLLDELKLYGQKRSLIVLSEKKFYELCDRKDVKSISHRIGNDSDNIKGWSLEIFEDFDISKCKCLEKVTFVKIAGYYVVKCFSKAGYKLESQKEKMVIIE